MSQKHQPHGNEKKERTKQVDLMKKAEKVTNAKILDLTLKHLARRLETSVGHHSVLE